MHCSFLWLSLRKTASLRQPCSVNHSGYLNVKTVNCICICEVHVLYTWTAEVFGWVNFEGDLVSYFFSALYVMHTSINNNFDAHFVQYQRNLSQNKDTRRQRYNVKVKLACYFPTIIFVSVHAWKKKSCTLSPRKKVSGQQCLHSFESNKFSAEWWTESVMTWVTSKSINFWEKQVNLKLIYH